MTDTYPPNAPPNTDRKDVIEIKDDRPLIPTCPTCKQLFTRCQCKDRDIKK